MGVGYMSDREPTDGPPDGIAAAVLESVPESLDAFLADRVERFADRPLLDYFEKGRTVTYSEFSRFVDEATSALVAAGVQPGDRVGVLLPNIPLFPVLTFALARVGAICVPINTRYTSTELDYVANDAAIDWLIVSDDLRGAVSDAEVFNRLPDSNILRPHTNEVRLELNGAVRDDIGGLDHQVSLDEVTHIQYTSGTTGFPKGCLLTQRYWLTAAASYAATGRGRARALEDSPYFYMSGPLLLTVTIWSGGTTMIPNRPSLTRLLSWLAEYDIDWCWLPPQLLKFPESELDRAHNLDAASIYATEPEQIKAIEARFGVAVRDAWSMTETGFGTYVPRDQPEMMYDRSIGIPMPLREFKIVDEELNELPNGEAGELCVRGPGMFLGYHNRPDANAELLIDGGWFRTGDIARRDDRGWLYFLGRAKDMVRRSGENISCAEVEAAICLMPEVRDCAVLAVPDEWRDEEVKVYVVLMDGFDKASVTPDMITNWAADRLASFKVPRYVEYRDELPLTPSDKVAKGVLREEKGDLREDSYDRVDGVWR
ncbi:class I adenylate-forming enzyme family protein [Fodinicola acaciae]|uniref:class I adenylate-forming enzyme family protein n=1 Tax=Fodinicola acaciae TaxID=2681555 RepID=UPI0013D6C82B|nr:AMP-binding protein [Fodinicola acaciae]